MPKASAPATPPESQNETASAQPTSLTEDLSGWWEGFQAAQPKAVHEVRKITRRAQAESGVSDMKKKVRRQWRDLRRAAAPVRDHDAAGEHLRDALKELGASATAQQRFEKGWAERRAQLLKRHPLPAQPPQGYDLPADWSARAEGALNKDRRALLKEGKALMKQADDPSNTDDWHDWRKRMKRYRYTLELSGKAPKVLKRMLEHLGRLQDAEVLLELLEAETEHFTRKDLAALRAREQQAGLDARAAARKLWPALKAELKGETPNGPDEADPASEETQPTTAPRPRTPRQPSKASTSQKKVSEKQPSAAKTKASPARSSTPKPTTAATTKTNAKSKAKATTTTTRKPTAQQPTRAAQADAAEPARRTRKTASTATTNKAQAHSKAPATRSRKKSGS
ncbi:CHAD domain-containing protein [Deinococcus radiophilus]|uniref:CHAD domain-containing protein n=1 Tax=Deinococcus radiophilus TaxID=32062 RepID=A0A3S0IS48_9DEIO|nr:CHAD domain-containing protein [Deinococcus radiophilus]RTR30282.1 CHAD domain-containing protein [Deinococcus radiophilus]UFA49922.1 CHAD domain-containing protein [Deinococcus radiophilus]